MTRVRAVAPLIAAALLTGLAFLTVHRAGCDDPGRYVPVAGGYALVGGCVAPGDLLVTEPRPAPEPADGSDARG